MIKNFENQTFELSETELKVVSIIVERFRQKPGIKNIVTNNQIIEGFKSKMNVELKEARVRKIIQYIRVNDLIPGLIATSKGYYCTDNIQEIENWIESIIQRENAIKKTRQSIEKYLIKLKNEKRITSLAPEIKFDFG